MELPSGWSGVELRICTPILAYNSLFKPATKLVPLSDTSTLGTPIRLNINNKASQASLAVSPLSGRASTHLDAESIRQIIYWCPLEDFGSSGPIKSMDTCSNGT